MATNCEVICDMQRESRFRLLEVRVVIGRIGGYREFQPCDGDRSDTPCPTSKRAKMFNKFSRFPEVSD